MLYMVTFTINISPMLAYMPYMDPMGDFGSTTHVFQSFSRHGMARTRPICGRSAAASAVWFAMKNTDRKVRAWDVRELPVEGRNGSSLFCYE